MCSALGARLTALAVEGKLPVYAASPGEVDDVKREKDEFFSRMLADAEAAHGHDLIVVGYRGHLWATCCSARRPTAWPTTRTAQ